MNAKANGPIEAAIVILMSILCLMLLGWITSCTQVKSGHPSVGARLVVQYAVLKYVGQAGDSNSQNLRAGRVAYVAGKAKDIVDNGVSSTIPELEKIVRMSIDWDKFSLQDRMLIEGLILVVRQELESRIGMGDETLSAEHKLLVAEVLGWVVDVSSTFHLSEQENRQIENAIEIAYDV